MAEQPLEKSACDGVLRPHGCGYRPPPGAISHLYTAPNGGGTEGRHAMDLSAHGFGDTATYDYQAQLRRYGPGFHGTDEAKPRFLALDFESLFGIGSNYLTAKACANEFGTAATMSCYPTLEELHDFFACNPHEAAAALGSGGEGGAGGAKPGQPAIIGVISTEPGIVAVSWKTRAGHTSFLVKVGPTSRLVPVTDSAATSFSTTLAMPPGAGGEFNVTVTAFIGNTAGNPSMPRTVTVVAATATSEPPVVEPPPVPVLPTPVEKLDAFDRETVEIMVHFYNPARNPMRAERMTKLAESLRERGLV